MTQKPKMQLKSERASSKYVTYTAKGSFFALWLMFGFVACSTPRQIDGGIHCKEEKAPVPVLVTYYVRMGAEKELQEEISRAWKIYQDERRVLDQPHICVLEREGSTHFRIMEIFVLGGPFAMEYPSERVEQVWEKMRSLCEKREGSAGPVEWRYIEITIPHKYNFRPIPKGVRPNY